jgi:hypothetical protein
MVELLFPRTLKRGYERRDLDTHRSRLTGVRQRLRNVSFLRR